ncbi:MAG: hypothetical protein C0404_08600 [Verrucomicrobia bacterium]|nr:hypothetical protein [Verrucomicrobiota bacterium]
MKTLNRLKDLKTQRGPVFLAAGFFDGLHRGHLQVVRTAVAQAGRAGGSAWVLTFDPHPMKVLHPEIAPPLLTSHRHKLLLLEGTGIHGCLVMQFTHRLAQLAPTEFASQLALVIPPVKGIVVGENWRFGRKGKGDPALLSKLCRGMGLSVRVVKPVLLDGAVISSTRIREAIIRGELAAAAKMLGRPFSLLGTVVRGLGIGTGLGFPTANLDPHNEVLPPMGVYAVEAMLGRRRYRGVVSIGLRPTVVRSATKPVVELHIFDFHEQLYGKDIEVSFVKYLRPEKKFDSEEELKQQIAADVAAARGLLKQ